MAKKQVDNTNNKPNKQVNTKKRKKEGLKSIEVIKHRIRTRAANKQLKQRKLEMALRSELMHKLEVQFSAVDVVQIEVQDSILADFLVTLEDPAITELYYYEQDAIDAHLFTFRPKSIF